MYDLNDYEYFEDLNFGLTKHVPNDKDILDVGCGQGMLGNYYRKKGNNVWGIDKVMETVAINKKRLNRYFNADVTDYKKIKRLLGSKKFDVIMFADVLEHFYDPIEVVKFYKSFLKPNGLIYISVPNFVVFYTRLQILFGNFYYVAAGTQDKTHIRIFTKNNIRLFLKATSLEKIKVDITPGIARWIVLHARHFFKKTKVNHGDSFDRRAIMDSTIYKIYSKYFYFAEYLFCKIFPGLLAFQYIIIAKNKINTRLQR